MNEITKDITYVVTRYFLFPLILIAASAIWFFLKKQKDELAEKTELKRQKKIKDKYRKELEELELIEKLKSEVHKEREF